MNTEKKIVAVSFVAGAVLASFAAYLLLRPSLPSVQALRCDVQPNEFLNISGFEIKILDTDLKMPKPRKGDSQQARMASLQWRCTVKNISTVAVRYDLKAELLDKDGFVLAAATVDSQYGQGDLSSGQSHTVHDDIVLKYSRARTLASSRVTPKALKTNTQIEQERWQTARAALTEQQNRLAAAQAERQKRIKEAGAKWKDLKEGMTKSEVETLLGKPKTVHPYSTIGDVWEYSAIEGSYTTPQVKFTPSGEVKGWTMP